MLGLLLSAAAVAQIPEGARQRLELLYTHGEHRQTITVAEALLLEYPDDPDLYWMIARAYFEVGELEHREETDMDKEAWYEEMLAWADAGLSVAPEHGHLWFARGAALARLGTTRGIAASLFLADDVEAAWLRAAQDGTVYASAQNEEVLPCDIYVCLGVFYRLLPDWWLVDALVGTRGSLRDSLDWLEQANACSPGRINVLKELGATQLCMAQQSGDDTLRSAGEASLQEAVTLPVRNRVDALDQTHSHWLLANPSQACSYSRDGQVDVDKQALLEQHGHP